ncbi:uncharacterized protein [Musca autumnalis]|uniref:uncharacterized protein n=1 Tax=Musca autumnalis TaxID=221902 RepID=UPI003CF2BDA6
MAESKVLRKFKALAALLLDLETDFNATKSSVTMFDAGPRKVELKRLWARINSIYENVCVECSVSKDEVAYLYRQCREAYMSCSAQMGELSQTFVDNSTLSSTIASPSHRARFPENNVADHRLRLPPCTTEIFHGDYLSWPSFRDMFTAVYIDCKSITPVERLFYLRQSTQGEALEIVKKSPLTNDGFANAWSNLKDRYENKRILINSQLKILFNLVAVKNESAGEIKRLQRDVNNCITSLKLHKIDIDSWDPIFVFLCSTKLPLTTLSLWEQTVSNKTEISKWSDLDCFLTARFQSLETVFDLTNTESLEIAGSEDILSPIERLKHGSKLNKCSCFICSEDHIMKYCPTFLKMTQSEKFRVVKRNNLCIRCFGNNHLLKNCSSTSCCSICKGKHHTMLHRQSQKLNSDSNADDVRHSTMQQANVQNCFASAHNQVLLGTAIVNIDVNGNNYTARALIDSGSQATFITEKLQRRLNLAVRRVNTRVSGLNDAIAGSSVKQCNFVLKSPHSEECDVDVSAYVLPRLTGNLPSYTIDIPNYISLGIAPLADPKFGRSGQVDILIGGDIYPQILLDGIQRRILGSLVAQETIFGWVLTGPISETSSLISCCTLVDSELSHVVKYSPQSRCCEKYNVDIIRSVDRMPHLKGMGPSSSVSQSIKGPSSSYTLSGQGPRSSKAIVNSGPRSSKVKSNNFSKIVSQNGPSSCKEKTENGPSSSNYNANGENRSSKGVYGMEPICPEVANTSIPAFSRRKIFTDDATSYLMMPIDGPCAKGQTVVSKSRRLL